jgi:hypothetical protein
VTRFLTAIVDTVVGCCDPDEVLVFGSYAKGLARRDSDVDLLVVGDFPQSGHLRAREVRDRLYGFPLAIDLHLVTRAELAAAAPGTFLRSIQASAVSLYRRNPTEVGVSTARGGGTMRAPAALKVVAFNIEQSRNGKASSQKD